MARVKPVGDERVAEKRELQAANDAGQAEVQQRFDQEQAQGYVGEVPDPTPNEAYTVAGVTGGAPTPETSPELAAEAFRATNARSRGAGVRPAPVANAPESTGEEGK